MAAAAATESSKHEKNTLLISTHTTEKEKKELPIHSRLEYEILAGWLPSSSSFFRSFPFSFPSSPLVWKQIRFVNLVPWKISIGSEKERSELRTS